VEASNAAAEHVRRGRADGDLGGQLEAREQAGRERGRHLALGQLHREVHVHVGVVLAVVGQHRGRALHMHGGPG